MNYKEKVLQSQNELEIIKRSEIEIVVKAKRGPSQHTVIPLEITEEIAFLSAAIIGDGHLKKEKLQISLECTNRLLVNSIKEISKIIFNRDFNYYMRKPRLGQKDSYRLHMDSKAIYSLLKEVFEIPPGKKSDIVKVPQFILETKNNSIKSAFLIGIMVTEGGNRKRGLGLSSASKKLRDDIICLLNDLQIKTILDRWINKKYNKEYYGLVYKKENITKIIEMCKSEKVREAIYNCPNLFPSINLKI